jgi:cytochrome b561
MAPSTAARGLQPSVLYYDKPTIILHWITAILVGILWVIGQTVDFWPKGPLRVDYVSVHITLGAFLGLVLVTRLTWRMTRGLVLPPDRHRILALAAKTLHVVLYLLLIVTVGLGVTNAWVHGDNIYNLFKIASFAPNDHALQSSIGDWHALAANSLLIAAGCHALAALSHHFMLRDDVLRRMLPRSRAVERN